jgi:hypothetical protein
MAILLPAAGRHREMADEERTIYIHVNSECYWAHRAGILNGSSADNAGKGDKQRNGWLVIFSLLWDGVLVRLMLISYAESQDFSLTKAHHANETSFFFMISFEMA